MRIKWHGAKSSKPKRSDLAEYVGKRLHALRQEHQTSMRALADATGMSNAFICQVENGQSIPTIDTLYRLATHFGVSIGWFVDGYKPAKRG